MAAPRDNSSRNTGPLITDRAELAALEAKNALLQFDEVRRLIGLRLGNLQLTPHDVCQLQKIAVDGIFAAAGTFRQVPIIILQTKLRPPPWHDVPRYVDEMCAYANSVAHDPLLVSAYLMWRLNWIHPFVDGNGRTARAVSYLALCCGTGLDLPGTVTVPDLIVKNRQAYYSALDQADAAWETDKLDVSKMRELIERLLIEQLNTAI